DEGQKHRLCFVGIGQFGRPLLNPRFKRGIELPQLLFGSFLCRVSSRERVGHGIERRPEMANLRLWILYPHASIVVAVTPFRGDFEQSLDRFSKKPAGSKDCRQSGREQTESDQGYSTSGGVLDRRKRFGFRLPSAEEEIQWR